MAALSQDKFIANNEAADGDILVEHKPIFTTSSCSSTLTPYHLNIINTFPWMDQFIKVCHDGMIDTNARSIETMMNFYYKNIKESLYECYSEPIRAKKLKTSMSEVLMFFHMSYSELKLPIESSQYLTKMSDLMALYLDMEIEASRSGSESLQNIASKITSCFYIYFGSSHFHILDTILKTKMINRDSCELSDLIFRRVLRDSPGSSVNVITYMRYLLAFKLWKEIMISAEKRKRIQLMAEHLLIPPPDLKEKLFSTKVLTDIFPKIPESVPNITRFLLETKYIVRDKIEMFLKVIADSEHKSASLDHQNLASANYPYIPDLKLQEDDEHHWFMDDLSNISLESDTENRFLSDEINNGLKNKKIGKLNHGVGSEITFEDTAEDENNSKVEEIEGIIKKDYINQVDSFWEGDTMDVAAEVELPSSPLDVTDIPTIKIEPQSSQSKENIVYPWEISNTHSYQNCNEFDSKLDIVVEKNPEQALIFDSLNGPHFNINKTQVFQTFSNIEDHSLVPELGLIRSEQLPTDSKSVDIPRTQSILNEKYFPLKRINFPSQNLNSEPLCEEQNEEISSEEHNEELSSEEFNEEVNLRKLNLHYINQRFSGELEEARCFKECIAGRDLELNNVEKLSEQNEKTPPEKRGLVHDFTLKNDNKIYKFHVKLSSYWEKLNKHTWISLLFPLFSEQDTKTPRCTCFLCTQNYNTIMKNWKSAVTNLSRLPRDFSDIETLSGNIDNSVLKEMKESLQTTGLKLLVWDPEMDEVDTKIEELIKEENKYSNLPLKKRKSFSFNSYVKDEKKEISYPNTPMISIAEVELFKGKYGINAIDTNHPAGNGLPPPLNYVPDYLSHPDFPNTADIKCDDAIVQSNITNIPLDENPVLGAFTTTFIPEHQEQNRPKFKTPAQLKEFQHLSAAEDLINFSLSSRTYYNENREPGREKRKNRQKTKSSRKRIRAT